MKSVAIFLLGLCMAAAARKSYEGYELLRVVPNTVEELQFLRNLMVTDVHVDFWQEPARLGQPAEVLVGPEHLARIKQLLTGAKLEYTIPVPNMEDTLKPMWEEIDKKEGKRVFDINDFNTLADIYGWIQSLTTQCPTGVTCEVYNAGNSFEGNPIYIFKMSKAGAGRKAYWLDATIHAREWIATATILQVIDHLVSQGSASAISLVDRYDWYFMPVQNPDGYLYAWSDDRLWRKNRRPNSGSLCTGTDLNRNFDFRWGNEGVSHEPCSETYCGPVGGSEPETQVTQNQFFQLSSSLAAIVTIHAYGYMWMFPWGNTVNYNGLICDMPADYDQLMAVANPTADAIQNTWNTDRWARGTSCEVIYATTGGTDDFAKGAAGIQYAFCPELRGNSFIISADQIPLSFQEFYNGIVAMVNSINA